MRRMIGDKYLTDEMNALIDAVLAGESVKVFAYAGAGKSTSLRAIEKFIPCKSLYLVFNKSLEKEAKRLFDGSRLLISTGHSLAKRYLSKADGDKFQSRIRDIKANDVLKYARVTDGEIELAFNIKSNSRLIIETVNVFLSSASESVSQIHLSIGCNAHINRLVERKEISKKEADDMREMVVKYAQAFVDEQLNPDSMCPITHDVYFKKFQLSKPKLDFELIMFDESQDASSVMLAVVLNQSCRKVFVGDPFQSISQFRNAMNAMELIPEKKMEFSISFRFGQELADLANRILRHHDSEISIKGKGPSTSIIRGSSFKGVGEPMLYLTQNNNSLLDACIEARLAGVTFKLVNPSKTKYAISKLESLIALHSGKDRVSGEHSKFKSVEQVSLESKDTLSRTIAKIIVDDEDRANVLLAALKSESGKSDKPIDFYFSTAHGSKGLEFDHVMLGDDFLNAIEAFGSGNELSEQDLFLLYVAVTRARKTLVLADALYDALERDDRFKVAKANIPEFLTDNLIYPKEDNWVQAVMPLNLTGEEIEQGVIDAVQVRSQGRDHESVSFEPDENEMVSIEHDADTFEVESGSKERMQYPVADKGQNQIKILVGKKKIDGVDHEDINSLDSLHWLINDTSKFMSPNIAIVGKSGSGKTQATKAIVSQIMQGKENNTSGHPLGVLIFDLKADYIDSEFVQLNNAKVVKASRIPVNPFAIFNKDDEFAVVKCADIFTETMSKSFNFGSLQANILKDCVIKAYKSKGVISGDTATFNKEPPSVKDVIDTFFASEPKKDSLYSAMRDLSDYKIFEADASKCEPLYALLENNLIVFDLSEGLSEPIQSLIIAVLLDQFYFQMSSSKKPKQVQGHYRPVSRLILVDEAHSFLKQNFSSLDLILRRGREFGSGLILSTQKISDLITKDANYASLMEAWILHALSNPKLDEIRTVTGIQDSSQIAPIKSKLSKLAKHHSLFICNQLEEAINYQQSVAMWEYTAWYNARNGIKDEKELIHGG